MLRGLYGQSLSSLISYSIYKGTSMNQIYLSLGLMVLHCICLALTTEQVLKTFEDLQSRRSIWMNLSLSLITLGSLLMTCLGLPSWIMMVSLCSLALQVLSHLATFMS